MIIVKKNIRLIVITIISLLMVLTFSACAGDGEAGEEYVSEEETEKTVVEESDDLSGEEIKQMYAERIQEYLDNPDVFFSSMEQGEHVITCDEDGDNVPEFIELGYGSSFPYTSTVFKYVNGEVIKFPEKVDSVLSWADMQTPVLFYFNEDASTFAFYSWEQNAYINDDCDPRLLTTYRIDSDGEMHVEQRGVQQYGTGGGPTGENTYTTNEDAEQEKDRMIEDGEVFEYPWGTEGDVPESIDAHFGETTDETIEYLNEIGISVH